MGLGLGGSLMALSLAQPTAAQQAPGASAAGSGADALALPAVQVQGKQDGAPGDDNVNDPSQVISVGKTGTALKDLPANVQVIPRALLAEQGATMLRDSLYNASGVNVGGQDSKGYYDHFLIRGLNAQIYNDGFSDGDLLGGISHSLNGVERIEVLEGPGSALLGSGPPGGSINIVHYTPSDQLHYGGSIQAGSYGMISGSGYVTGPTGISGLDYRVDATVSHADGFRSLYSRDEEIRPELQWKTDHHTINFSLDARDIRETPDSYGLIYANGSPISNVSINAKYSTPFAFARGNYVRPTLTDAWRINDILTINNRFSYLHRSLDVLGNGDSTSTKISNGQVVGRQLRQQDDSDNSLDYQFEPVWRFATGGVKHTLLTGFEYQHQIIDTERSTAYLANLWTSYDFSIACVPGFHVGAGVNYVGKSYSDITNANSIPSYVIANAAFGYDTRRWGVDLNVHNLTDRRYFIAANAAGAYVGESLSAFVNLHASF
ncbi:TonB-dependent receptor plug domain-containing protein [Burkholderia gladioli]|uniref:TonB-dependent receptor plug domain-containing protein n=1 Tax=Burkholderia gladioli TaxID=28095 RepID=UPI001FC8BDF7|nr:TonB-dependent receptor [Burkholderia gladioli]